MIDVVLGASVFEGVRPDGFSGVESCLDVRRGRTRIAWRSEVGPVIGEDGVDLVGDGGDQPAQEVPGRAARHLLMQLDESELRGSIDGDEEIELALGGSNLGDVDMEIADRIGLELAFRRGFAFDLRKPGDPVALQTAMKGRTRQMRDGWLQSVEAVVERQQGMPPESDDHSLLLDGQDRRPRLLRACRQVGDRGPRFPLGDGLRIDAVALGQRPQALLTMLVL